MTGSIVIIMTIMVRRLPYTMVYAEAVKEHRQAIDKKHHSLMRDKIEEQLCFDPGVETKNRKPLRQPAPFAAEWEIRFGPDNRFRVFYSINEEKHEVHILAIGEKEGSSLFVGGVEIDP
jgi:mRNA-degrading endonuclease RelE of RelBE toxin-antitoxin system